MIYETGPMNPSLAVPFRPWRGAVDHLERMKKLPNLSVVGAIVRDQGEGEGEVKVKRDGEPVAHYRLLGKDLEHMRTGINGAAQILEAAGAKRISSAHQRGVFYEPGKHGDRAGFMAECDAAGYGPAQCTFGSFHIMGSTRMGGSPGTSATNPDGATWDVPNLVVADASCFPTASGVNPMVSIESIAHMNATRLATTLAKPN